MDCLILKKKVFEFSSTVSKTSGLSKKLKVSTLDIRIKQSGFKVSYSKVPSSDLLFVESEMVTNERSA